MNMKVTDPDGPLELVQSRLSGFQLVKNITRPPSAEFFDQVKSWIDECGHKHRQCPLLTGEPQSLPTRVLKTTQTQGDFKVQLHEGNGKKLRYITLSHCWGKDQPVMTTRANLADHFREISWSSLPKTFQDAIIITNGLGIEYLWIDSLCIVQDDKEDWGRESAEMKNMYGNSYLTIAAAAGEDSRYGLFWTEHSEKSQHQEARPASCARDTLISDTSPSPLFNRAWVLQERLLASRILYFCDNEVIFECSNHIRCQCSGINTTSPIPDPWASRGIRTDKVPAYNSLRYRFNNGNIKLIRKRLTRLISGAASEQDLWPRLSFAESCKMLELWDDVLYHYCRRRITKLSDRLTAISGIAGAFGATGAHGAYYGGMWEVDLMRMMLWHVHLGDDLTPEPPSEDDPPLAPSWSWAKVRGAWCYRRPHLATKVIARLIEGKLHLAIPDKFGALEKGIVTVEGKVAPAVIQYEALPSELSYADRLRRQEAKLTKDAEEAHMWPDFVLGAVPEPVKSGDVVQCVPTVVDEHSRPPVVYGVVLRGVEGDSNLFSRIGMFCGPTEWFQSCQYTKIRLC
jgi:hypothetical protein